MSAPLPVAVLVSGRGSNLQALLEAHAAGTLPVEFVLVASNTADAPALRRAEEYGVATLALDPANHGSRAEYDHELFRRIDASGARCIVLAGFMRVLDDTAVTPWRGHIINIHPSLLPRFRGLHTHRKAIDAGASEHGASVHFVTAELDGGPVIAQARLALRADDDADALGSRVLQLEHQLLPAVLRLLAGGRLALTDAGVTLDGNELTQPLELDHGRLTA